MSSTNFEKTVGAVAPTIYRVEEVAESLSPELRRCLTTEAPTEEQRKHLVGLGLIRAQQNALGSTFWWYTVLGDAVRARIILDNGRDEG